MAKDGDASSQPPGSKVKKHSKSKPKLPHGWVVRVSRSHPDRVYYFNTVTGDTTWELPGLLESDSDLQGNSFKSKKIKSLSSSHNKLPSARKRDLKHYIQQHHQQQLNPDIDKTEEEDLFDLDLEVAPVLPTFIIDNTSVDSSQQETTHTLNSEESSGKNIPKDKGAGDTRQGQEKQEGKSNRWKNLWDSQHLIIQTDTPLSGGEENQQVWELTPEELSIVRNPQCRKAAEAGNLGISSTLFNPLPARSAHQGSCLAQSVEKATLQTPAAPSVGDGVSEVSSSTDPNSNMGNRSSNVKDREQQACISDAQTSCTAESSVYDFKDVKNSSFPVPPTTTASFGKMLGTVWKQTGSIQDLPQTSSNEISLPSPLASGTSVMVEYRTGLKTSGGQRLASSDIGLQTASKIKTGALAATMKNNSSNQMLENRQGFRPVSPHVGTETKGGKALPKTDPVGIVRPTPFVPRVLTSNTATLGDKHCIERKILTATSYPDNSHLSSLINPQHKNSSAFPHRQNLKRSADSMNGSYADNHITPPSEWDNTSSQNKRTQGGGDTSPALENTLGDQVQGHRKKRKKKKKKSKSPDSVTNSPRGENYNQTSSLTAHQSAQSPSSSPSKAAGGNTTALPQNTAQHSPSLTEVLTKQEGPSSKGCPSGFPSPALSHSSTTSVWSDPPCRPGKALRGEGGNTLTFSPSESSAVVFSSHGLDVSGTSEAVAMEIDDDGDQMMMDLQELRENFQPEANEKAVGILTERVQQTCRPLTPTDGQTAATQLVYIVVDTNVLISSLRFVQNLCDMALKDYGRPYLVIPWIVLQELDAMKESGFRRRSLARKAQDAVRYLHSCLVSYHPRVRGQTPAEASQLTDVLPIQCNDDRILQCCLQYQNKYGLSSVILLTEDLNLVNKAVVMTIKCFTTKSLEPQLCEATVKCTSPPRDLKTEVAAGVRTTMGPSSQQQRGSVRHGEAAGSVSESGGSREVISTGVGGQRSSQNTDTLHLRQQRVLVDELLCGMKSVLKSVLPSLIEREMRETFGKLWLDIVFKKPPWSVHDLAVILQRHWIAVFGFKLNRDLQDTVNHLAVKLRPETATKLHMAEVRVLLDSSVQLIRAVHNLSPCANCVQQLEKLAQRAKNLNSAHDRVTSPSSSGPSQSSSHISSTSNKDNHRQSVSLPGLQAKSPTRPQSSASTSSSSSLLSSSSSMVIDSKWRRVSADD